MKTKEEYAALEEEARRRGVSYGILMGRTTPHERMEIIGEYKKRQRDKDEKKAHECLGCLYWRTLSSSGGDGIKVCHYLFDTGHVRSRAGGVCLSKDTTARVAVRTCIIDATDKSVLSGTKLVRGRKRK